MSEPIVLERAFPASYGAVTLHHAIVSGLQSRRLRQAVLVSVGVEVRDGSCVACVCLSPDALPTHVHKVDALYRFLARSLA